MRREREGRVGKRERVSRGYCLVIAPEDAHESCLVIAPEDAHGHWPAIAPEDAHESCFVIAPEDAHGHWHVIAPEGTATSGPVYNGIPVRSRSCVSSWHCRICRFPARCGRSQLCAEMLNLRSLQSREQNEACSLLSKLAPQKPNGAVKVP